MLIIKILGICDYRETLKKMQSFTHQRTDQTPDEIWCLEHQAVFTQGQAGSQKHILNPDPIPVVQSDRGGQVTYHGPGQLICYFLINLKRKKMGIKIFVEKLEQAVIHCLARYQIKAKRHPSAPGVYVTGQKICSLGLRVRKGCTYHGLSLNVNMNLNPFKQIHPCGFPKLAMAQTKDLQGPTNIAEARSVLLNSLLNTLDYQKVSYAT